MSYLVVSAFVIAILPLAFALMFVPSLTRKYGVMVFNLIAWLAFWGPIASVVNYLVQAFASHSYQTINLGGNVTYGAFPFIMAHTQTLMSIAGDIMFSVPVIAFALSSGSAYAMTQVAGAVAGISRSIATRASSRMTTAEGIRGEENTAKENVAEGQAVKDAGYGNREIGRGLFDVERAAGMFAASRTDYYRELMSAYSPKQVAEAGVKTKAQEIGRSENFTSPYQADIMGQRMMGQQIADTLGAWQEYQKAKASGYTGSFVQYLEQSSRYRTASNIAEAQQMQKMADKYFGGSLDKEMQYLSYISAVRRLGDARGFEESYEKAKEYGFTGDRVDYEKFQESIHLQSIYGQNVATVRGAHDTGESIIGYVEKQRRGLGDRAYVDSLAYLNLFDRVPTANLVLAALKKEMYDYGRNISLAPTPERAKERGEWEEWKKYTDYLLTKDFLKNPVVQAQWEGAQKFASTIIGRQIPQALLMKENDVRFRSVEKSVADYLETFKGAGVFNEAAVVTDAEINYLNSSLKQSMEHRNMGQMISKLNADLGLGTPGLSPIKADISSNISSNITDELSKTTGLNITENALRERLMAVNYSIAAANPDNALEKQKEFFDSLRSAVKSGDIQKVAEMLGYSYATPDDLKKQHAKGSDLADQVQQQYDQVSTAVKEEASLLKGMFVDSVKKKLTPDSKQMQGVNETFKNFGDLWSDWDVGGGD